MLSFLVLNWTTQSCCDKHKCTLGKKGNSTSYNIPPPTDICTFWLASASVASRCTQGQEVQWQTPGPACAAWWMSHMWNWESHCDDSAPAPVLGQAALTALGRPGLRPAFGYLEIRYTQKYNSSTFRWMGSPTYIIITPTTRHGTIIHVLWIRTNYVTVVRN